MKTAVEWLIARFHYEGFIGTFCSEEQIKAKTDVMIEIIEQAKQMEKEQIINAYETAMETDIYNEPLKIGKDYYNQTFKSE